MLLISETKPRPTPELSSVKAYFIDITEYNHWELDYWWLNGRLIEEVNYLCNEGLKSDKK